MLPTTMINSSKKRLTSLVSLRKSVTGNSCLQRNAKVRLAVKSSCHPVKCMELTPIKWGMLRK